ncbi:hypothetical protein HMPREF3198_01095 [Winkia neuii]|nr:hypothetical protein HMPREF3198_01095 [Winkia neuii]
MNGLLCLSEQLFRYKYIYRRGRSQRLRVYHQTWAPQLGACCGL